MAPKVWKNKIKASVAEDDHHLQHAHKKRRTNTDDTSFSEHSTISKNKPHVPPCSKVKIESIVVVPDHRPTSDDQEDEKDHGIHLGKKLSAIGTEKKKLLVIPLRGIFVHRAHRWWPETIPRNSRPDFCYGHFLVYVRPYCVDFLKFCFERFNVGLWSSAREKNLQGVLDNIIGDLKNKLLFTWDQKHCTDSGFKCLGKKDKPLFLKELSHLWEKKHPNLPWSDGEYSASNTLLVTYPEKALLNPPNTSIFPQSYDPENMKDDLLGPNGELRAFLSGLAEAEDVQTYVKDHPIGDPEITPSHPDWDHYFKIICSINKKRFGKRTKIEENPVAANKKDTKQKVKIVEPEKDDSMSEDEDDEGFDNEDMIAMRRKRLHRSNNLERRDRMSLLSKPLQTRKRQRCPPHRRPMVKKGGVHVVATPHYDSGIVFSCKSCNRNFKSDMALQSHNQAKHK